MKKNVISTVVASLLLSTSLGAFSLFNIDPIQRIENNKQLIKKYEKAISELKAENKYISQEKAKNPELYVKRKLFENLKDKYIYRIKLNGSKADALNFMVENNIVSVNMNMKQEEKDENGYFYNSESFSSSYKIPSDVVQEKIKHKVEGDYFTIIMPKK